MYWGYHLICKTDTAQKMKFSIKDYISKCDQIRKELRICSHLLKNSLTENFIFCIVWAGKSKVARTLKYVTEI